MNSVKLLETISDRGGKFVYDTFLMNEDVWFINRSAKENPGRSYHDFKVLVAKSLEISVKNIAIVGSAKTGYSLNPSKKFREFSEESDVDLVIVSNDHYKSLWESYLNSVNTVLGQSYAKVAKDVFRHFVSVKAEDIAGEQVKFFSDWLDRVGELRRELQMNFLMPSEINYRVYQDWKYVEQYYVAGLNSLVRNALEK